MFSWVWCTHFSHLVTSKLVLALCSCVLANGLSVLNQRAPVCPRRCFPSLFSLSFTSLCPEQWRRGGWVMGLGSNLPEGPGTWKGRGQAMKWLFQGKAGLAATHVLPFPWDYAREELPSAANLVLIGFRERLHLFPKSTSHFDLLF